MPTGQAPLPFPPFEPHPVPQPVTGVQQAWPFTGQPGMLNPGPQPVGALPSAGYPMPPAPPTPAPDMFGPGTSAAREAAVAQARAANAGAPATGRPPVSMNSTARAAAAEQAAAARPPRPSTLVRDMFGPNAPVEDAITRQARLYDSVGRSPRVAAQVGPNPPSNLGPAAQGVRGAGGAGQPLGSGASNAGVWRTASGFNGPGTNLPPPPTGPQPRAGANLMQLLTGQRPTPVSPIRSTSPYRQTQVGGLRQAGANFAVGTAGLAAVNRALANQDSLVEKYLGSNPLDAGQQDALRRILGNTGRPAAVGTMVGGPVAGMILGVGGGAMQADVEARRWAAENGLPAQAAIGVAETGLAGGGPIGTAAKFGGELASILGIEDPIGGYVGAVQDAGIPVISDLAGMLGGGGGGPSGEEQAAAQAAAAQEARLTDTGYMLSTLQRAGLPASAAQQTVDEYKASLEMNRVLNETGQFGFGKTSDGQIVPMFDETGEPRTDLEPLTDADVEYMTARGIYAAIPELVVGEQQRLDSMNRAAAMQAILSQTTDPLMQMSQETVDAFNAAGDPVGAAYAQNQMNSRLAMMQALPMIQAIDEQQMWDQRIAQIQEQQMLNELMYGGGQSGTESLDDKIAGG